MKFKLVSDFVPRGDQPQAIQKLTEGIIEGRKDQVLLGVTGSGKSLDADEPLLIFTKEADGDFIPKLVKIGDFIDKILEQDATAQRISDGTLVSFAKANPLPTYYTLSFNPTTCQPEIKPITTFIRHNAPKTMYMVRTSCGREVLVTGDHNLWVLRNGRLCLVSTKEVLKTDYLPLPPSLPAMEKDLRYFNLLDFLADENLFVEANELVMRLVSLYGKKAILDILSKHLKAANSKLWYISRGWSGCRLRMKVFHSLLRDLSYRPTQAELATIKIISKSPKHSLPALLPVSCDLLKLLGYYIAEGCSPARCGYFVITAFARRSRIDLKDILKKLTITYSVRANSDFQISSTPLAIFLRKLVGHSARGKRLPEFWTRLSQGQLGLLLRAYFEGDGGVERGQVLAATASRRLASNLSYALLRFGIWARIRKVWKKATNTQHQGDWYWMVSISSQQNLRLFAENVGFLFSRKRSTLEQELSHIPDSNVDLIFGSGVGVNKIRQIIGMTQRQLATPCGINRSAVSLIESGKRCPKRSTMEKMVETFEDWVVRNGIADQEIAVDIEELRNLLNVKWTKVDSVVSLPYERPYVYDIGVEDNETFVAGHGGLFLHNTFVMANVIKNVGKPTLVISHNKTLAAQLYSEFKQFFPENSVEYFVSYYDYYQPEAYVPQTDTYIEKDASINDRIDRLRLKATSSLLERKDVIIVASVSCIYGIGSPQEWKESLVILLKGNSYPRQDLLRDLVSIQYQRNDISFTRGNFRVRGDVVEIYPAYLETALRVEFFGDEIERIAEIDPLTGKVLTDKDKVYIYPAKHFVTTGPRLEEAIKAIKKELAERLKELRSQNKLLEAQRLETRTNYDMEIMREVGYCTGIENYSRHLSGREPGEPPSCLINYFPQDFLTIIDESHVTIPQLNGMYKGDRSRKETLVEYGFRLPSALDNRPLKFAEFERLVNQVIYVSATPAPYELKKSKGVVVEQVIRPTGLVDPAVELRPTEGQIDNLIKEIEKRIERRERALVTTLTKRMAEDLCSFLVEKGLRVRYLHSEIETLNRVEILKDLRKGEFDCLVGINLLREGLDLPEVSLVAVLDADKEGFLRSETSLIQVCGRASRNVNGQVIMYADGVTQSMRRAITEMDRRRKKQLDYNRKLHITPQTIQKAIREEEEFIDETKQKAYGILRERGYDYLTEEQAPVVLKQLECEMSQAADNLDFELAAILRDKIFELKGLPHRKRVVHR